MTRSTRFPVAVHTLAMLSLEPGECFSSELIAKSAGTNSVVVRRVLALLQRAGFVECHAGVHGGAKLKVEPRQVSLLDVYEAVEDQPLFRLHDPHPDCPIACSVKEDLRNALQAAENGMKAELARMSLDKVTRRAAREHRRKRPC